MTESLRPLSYWSVATLITKLLSVQTKGYYFRELRGDIVKSVGVLWLLSPRPGLVLYVPWLCWNDNYRGRSHRAGAEVAQLTVDGASCLITVS